MNRWSDKTLEKREKSILKNYKIIRFYSNERLKVSNLGKALQLFFSGKMTVYADTGDTQCISGRRRSMKDAFRLCKYYFPDITYKYLWNSFIDIYLKEYSHLDLTESIKLSDVFNYCPDVDEYVRSFPTKMKRYDRKDLLINFLYWHRGDCLSVSSKVKVAASNLEKLYTKHGYNLKRKQNK